MNNTILKSILLASAAVMMAANVHAQSVHASVPFAFEANGKSMPAGDYSVRTTSEMGGGTLAMINEDTHASVLLKGVYVISDSVAPAKLVFAQRPEGYYLTEVWQGDIARAVQAPKGKQAFLASTQAATRVVIPAKH